METLINLVTVNNEAWASHRYRTAVVQEAMLMDGVIANVSRSFLMDASTCIYSKHMNYADFSDALGAKALGKRIVFDVCDDHSENSKHSDHYERMIGLADIVTCNSDAMRERIWHVYRKKAHMIPDPILMPAQDKIPNLDKWLWYGHPVGLKALELHLDLIEGKELEICTLTDRPVMRNGPTKVTMWSPDEQVQAFKRNGVAFIPYEGERAQHKSANRVIEALNASLVPVVINPIPATKDLLAFCETDPQNVNQDSIAKMVEGRKYVRKHYSVKEIAKQWTTVLTSK